MPVVVLGVGQHVIRSFVSFGVNAYLRRDQEPEQLDADITESYNPLASLFHSSFVDLHYWRSFNAIN